MQHFSTDSQLYHYFLYIFISIIISIFVTFYVSQFFHDYETADSVIVYILVKWVEARRNLRGCDPLNVHIASLYARLAFLCVTRSLIAGAPWWEEGF